MSTVRLQAVTLSLLSPKHEFHKRRSGHYAVGSEGSPREAPQVTAY